MSQTTPQPEHPWPPVRLRAAVFIEREGCVLLVRDPVYRGGCWILPGGAVEFDEPAPRGAEREVLEETSIVTRVRELWRIREIWEPENDFAKERPDVRKSLELIFIGDYVSGEIEIGNNPSRKADGIPRVSASRWVPLEQLGPTLESLPLYPEELFAHPPVISPRGQPLDSIFLPALDFTQPKP